MYWSLRETLCGVVFGGHRISKFERLGLNPVTLQDEMYAVCSRCYKVTLVDKKTLMEGRWTNIYDKS